MKTQIKRTGDLLVISLDGRLDYEATEPLRHDLHKLIPTPQKTDSAPKKIIFNLQNLEFVGSSGISAFVQTLREFNAQSATKPRYCNVRSEFKQVIKAFDEDQAFDFYENEERAKRSFEN